MKKIIFFFIVLIIGLYLTNSINDLESSRDYLEENRAVITNLIKEYKLLQKDVDFSFGYLDNDYKEYLVQIHTDSVRYIYKSNVTIDQKFKELTHTETYKPKIQNVAKKIKMANAIWIQTQNIYLSGFLQKATVISFKPQRLNTPFTPTKFVTLMILDNQQVIKMSDKELEKFEIYTIEPGIYQTISNQFR